VVSGLYTSERSKKGVTGSLGGTSNPARETSKSADVTRQIDDDFEGLNHRLEVLLERRVDLHVEIVKLRSEAYGYLKEIGEYLSASHRNLPVAIQTAMLQYKKEMQAAFTEKRSALSMTENFDRREKSLDELSKSVKDYVDGLADEHSLRYAVPTEKVFKAIELLESLDRKSRKLDIEILEIFSKLNKNVSSALRVLTGYDASGATLPHDSSQ